MWSIFHPKNKIKLWMTRESQGRGRQIFGSSLQANFKTRADLGGRTPPFSLSDSNPCRPFVLFWDIHVRLTDPKVFKRHLGRQNELIWRGGASKKRKKEVFQKVSENAFFGLFFQKFACGAENAKIGTKQCLGRARKINLVDLRKKVEKKFSKIFENPPPPLSRKS